MTDNLPTISDETLGRWEVLLADRSASRSWSVSPVAVLALVKELREHRRGHRAAPLCDRCGKKVGNWPLPPGSYVLGCGATLTVDSDGKAIACGWNE